MVFIRSTSPSADPNGIHDIAAAIALAWGNVCAPAIIHRPRTVANTTGIERSDAFIDVITNPVGVGVFDARAATHPGSIIVNAGTVIGSGVCRIVASVRVSATWARRRIDGQGVSFE